MLQPICRTAAFRDGLLGALWLCLLPCLVISPLPSQAQVSSLLPKVDEGGPSTGATEGLEEAQTLRERKQLWRGRRAEYLSTWHGAADELAKIETLLEELEVVRDEELTGTPAELSQQLQVTEQELSLARKSRRALQDDVERMTTRRRRLPELLAAARVRLRNLQASSTSGELVEPGPDAIATPADEEALGSTDSGEALESLRLSATQAEVDAYQTELDSHNARSELLDRRIQLAELRSTQLARRVDALRKALRSAQRKQVRADAQRTEAELGRLIDWPKSVHTAVAELAAQNAKLADAWTGDEGLVDKIETVNERLSRARAQVADVEEEFERISKQVEVAGLGDTVGALLRKERAEAPDVGMYQRFVRLRTEQLGAAQLQQVLLNEQRDQLNDLELRTEQFLQPFAKELNAAAERDEVRKLVRSLFGDQRRYLDALIADHEAYLQHLMDFDEEQRQLVERSQALINFIDERVLWVPSGTAITGSMLHDSLMAIRWLIDSQFISQPLRALGELLEDRTLATVALLVALLLFYFLRPRIRQQLVTLAEQGRRSNEEGSNTTLAMAAVTVVLILPPPLALFWFAESLAASTQATLYTRSLAGGLSATALLWLSIRFLRCLVVEPGGLAVSRADWPAAVCRRLHRQLGLLAAALLPLSLLVFMLETRADDGARESLGRLCFTMGCLACALFGHRVLQAHGSLAPMLAERRLWFSKPWLRPAAHAFVVATPIILALGALTGYYWTALQLAIRQHFTWTMLFSVVLLADLLRRWVTGARRRVESARAAEELATTKSIAPMPGGLSVTLGNAAERAPEKPRLDLETASNHTSRIIRLSLTVVTALALATIWADLIPAAGVLREVEVWRASEEVAITTPNQDGSESITTERREVPITLADLGFALMVAATAFVLLRSVPGFIEVTLFRRLHTGERYAYSTIIKYAIGMTGTALSLEAIGVSWASIQWLVAAVGLGLGFGLQEIFANFVSGLIILFERPLRVGDTVTVGDTSGVVTRIHIRATHITSFDRKELVVPNKDLVTSKLVNWSLSDAILRVDVAVGIAYGSDTEYAAQLLRQVARRNPLILADPAPQVLFLRFDDSSLGFELRAFVAETDHNLRVRHELHMAVDRAFREAGIEIAFPQRDIHVRRVPESLLLAQSPADVRTLGGPEAVPPVMSKQPAE